MEKSHKSSKQKKSTKRPTHTPSKPRMRSGWTPERRARHAIAMKKWKPWEKSTGPRTKAGKKRSSQNAAKPHLRYDPDIMMKRALVAQAHYVSEINRFIVLEKFPFKNELLKRRVRYRRRALLRKGQRINAQLQAAFIYAKLADLRVIPANTGISWSSPLGEDSEGQK